MATPHSPLLPKPTHLLMSDGVPIDESEVDSESESNWIRWSAARRFGTVILICLPSAVLAILAPLAFLWYLWTSHADNELWRRIMVAGFCTRVVSLLSMALRTATIFLATACTSMLAAFTLERGLLVLSKVAALSSIRYINGGPHNLMFLFFGGAGFKRKFVTGLFVSVLLITTLLSQLTSTALLSDLRPGLVPGNSQHIQLPFRLNETYTQDSSDTDEYEELWSSKPPFYPVFAEYSEPPTPYQDDSISDTGTILRAMLPLASEQDRTLIQNYTGPATVFDSRVICMRPQINITGIESYGDFDGQTLAAIEGIMEVVASAPGVYNVVGVTPFLCPIVFTPGEGDTESAVTLCNVNTPGVLVSPFQNPSTLNLTSPGPGYIIGTLSYLVINTTGTIEQWQAAVGNTTSPTWSYQDQNEWMDVFPGNLSADVRVSLSACYANVYAVDTQVNAFSSTPRTEPTIGWDIQQGVFDSQAVREQLGATVPVASQQDRGIMALQSRPSWIIEPNLTENALTYEAENSWYGWTTNDFASNGSLSFCTSCFCCSESLDHGWAANRYIATVFQGIFQDTQKPTLALQAFITTMFQVGYYGDINQFGTVAPTVMQSFVSVQVPSGFTGLIIVTSVLMAHMVLVAASVVLFQTRTRYSMLGNSWQAVAQTYSPETAGIHAHSSTLSDTEVEKILIAGGRGTTRVGLGKLDSQRIAVVAM